MFHDIVSNLSLAPSATAQLSYYWRRLKKEQLTRQLSALMAVALIALQLVTIIAPPDPATASSSNDIIQGGIGYNHPGSTCPKGSNCHPQKTMLGVYDSNAEIRALFNHYGVYKVDIQNAKGGSLNSSNHKLLSLGRNRQTAEDQEVYVGNHKYFIKPLYLLGDNLKYEVLEGQRHGDGKYFAVMYNCGNLVITDTTPTHAVSGPVSGTGTGTPSSSGFTTGPSSSSPSTPQPDTPAPAIPETPTPTGNPDIFVSKTGVLVSAANGSKKDANGATAQPGDTIEYHLTTKNTGTSTANEFTVTEGVNDILEYADITNTGGAILTDGNLTWPTTSIKAGSSYVATFQVRVKTPLPSAPTSISDPKSYDLVMDNVYGNVVSVNLAAPNTAKQVEVASASLPQTGPGLATFMVLALIGAIVYFYYRNRQLIKEISMLRADHHGYGGDV